jgi:hypothetical protein
MKIVVFLACAILYGFMPAIADFRYEYLFILFPILLGLIYYVLHGKDWPPRLVPWLLACIAGGRVAAYCWLNSRHGRIGPLVDADVWVFGGLAAVSFAFAWWRRINGHTETPTSTNPKINVS